MPPKRNRKKKKGAPSGQPVSVAPSALSSPRQSSFPQMEISPPLKMPAGFNVDDFLFSKLYKSVNVEGRRTINEVLQAIFRQRVGGNTSAYTVHELFTEIIISKKKMSSIKSKLDVRLLKEKLLTAEFDVSCGIYLLQKVFCSDYKKLPIHCQAQIQTFRELRNTLSHNYPLVHHEFEPDDEKLNISLKTNEDLDFLLNEIRKLEEKKNGIDAVKELGEIEKHINEKKKEKHVIIEIEKLRIILNDILEDVGTVFEEDLTRCKSMINRNLTYISRAKVQQYDQNTYDEEVERFKKDPIHELITKAREELKQQYKKLRVANPCPWMLWDQAEKTSVVNFYIDKIYTPLRIEGPKTEIFTEELLVANKNLGKETVVSPALVVSGLAGSGKTSLCLYLLHHWAEGTHEIKALKDYNLVIFLEMRTIRSNTLVDYLKTQRMKKSTGDISSDNLVQRLDDLKLLFIIDGYDEAKKSSQKIVEDIFAMFSDQRILITTRGEFCDEVKRTATKHRVEYLTVEICGFDSTRIKEFTDKVFSVINRSMNHHTQTCSARDSSEFLLYVQKRTKILEKLLELPLTLALMIYLWVDCPETLGRVTTCTSLYYELFCLYQKKLKDRLNDPCSDNTIENLLLLIGKKAWQLLINEETVLSKEDEKEIERQCENEGVPKKELMSAFLVYEYNDNAPECEHDYSFIHKTQMEYLSAYFLVEETEEESLHCALELFAGSGFHQVLLFLVGHFARKKIMEPNLSKIFELLDKADVKSDDFDFWWKLLAESSNNRKFLWKICQMKLPQAKWKLSQNNVVSGLELLIAAPTNIKELTIEIENGTDPYEIKDLLSTMSTMKAKLWKRYNKRNPILTELFFWHHFQAKSTKPSDQLIRTLYPWGHLRDFTGSVGEQSEKNEVLNYCYKVKNLRIRVDTCGAQVCLANSLKRISSSVRQLRVMMVLDPEKCDAGSLVCLSNDDFKGHLELTLPNMNDENKKWMVQVVKNLSGEYGCSRLFLEKSTLSFSTVLCIMMMLRDVVQEKLTVETINELTNQQMIDLEKQTKVTQMDVNWIAS